MISDLIGVFSLLKVILLAILGVVFITETRKKSLRPLGFLLFAIGSSFLIDNVYIRNVIKKAKDCQVIIESGDTNLLELILAKGVNITIIAWLLLILISEVWIRFSIGNNK